MSETKDLKRQEEEFVLKVIDSNYLMLSTCYKRLLGGIDK